MAAVTVMSAWPAPVSTRRLASTPGHGTSSFRSVVTPFVVGVEQVMSSVVLTADVS